MSTSTLEAKVVSAEVEQFASIFRAYIDCSAEVQAIIRDMALIVDGDEATPEEKSRAVGVMVEALFPGFAFELQSDIENWADANQSAAIELKEQEASFGDAVRSLLKQRGLSQEELADRIGVGQPAVANMLNRKCRPQQRTIARIAAALEVAPEDLWRQ